MHRRNYYDYVHAPDVNANLFCDDMLSQWLLNPGTEVDPGYRFPNCGGSTVEWLHRCDSSIETPYIGGECVGLDENEMPIPPVKPVNSFPPHWIRGSFCTSRNDPDLFMHKADE